jgi:hypothetical protein
MGPRGPALTNRVALYLALLIAAFIAGDLVLNGGNILLFLAKKFIFLMDWVEFWR